MKKQNKFILYFWCLFTLLNTNSCLSQQSKPYKNDIKNPCLLNEDVENNLKIIQSNVKDILKGKDECVLRLLDSLTNKAITAKKEQYFETLDSICTVRDGYVSEYYWEIGQKLFNDNFIGFFNYIYKNRNKKSCLESVFIDAVSVEINMSENRNKKMEEIEYYLLEQTKSFNFSNAQKEYLKKLKNQFNPNILD